MEEEITFILEKQKLNKYILSSYESEAELIHDMRKDLNTLCKYIKEKRTEGCDEWSLLGKK